MKSIFKKFIAVILTLTIILSVSAVGAFANEIGVNNIKMDYPVIYIPGLEGDYFKGLSTETEDDDTQIWFPEGSIIATAVVKNIAGLLISILTRNGDFFTSTMTDLVDDLFGDFVCDSNGVPNSDTGKKKQSDTQLKSGYGYENAYEFVYDWRIDMREIAEDLDEYIDFVLDLTGSDKVGLVAHSMGNCVLSTYVYEHYNSFSQKEKSKIDSAVLVAGAMDGVGTCEDPFSGNMSIESHSFMRFMRDALSTNSTLQAVYYILEMLYSLNYIDPVTEFADTLVNDFIQDGFNEVLSQTLCSIPGFFTLMSNERYQEAKEWIFNTGEKKEKYSRVIEISDYYHNTVQANNESNVQSLIDGGTKVGIIAQYGFTFVPITCDNERMSDTVISTQKASFGATCSSVDGTLGENYTQKNECCGKNHISPDNQIDASTCAFPEITWFGKGISHEPDFEFIGELSNMIIYSEKQIDVFTYSSYPQFMKSVNGSQLVPLEKVEVEPFRKRDLFEIITSLIGLI